MTYLDKEETSLYMEGDILITDPCYIEKETDDFSTNSFYNRNFPDRCIAKRTIYGDWLCTLFECEADDVELVRTYITELIESNQNLYPGKVIGNFCADAGAVGVFYLDDVLKYNPDFNYHIEKPWTATVIKNFKGTVHYIKTNINGHVYAHIVGIGENGFYSLQTGY